MVKHVTRRMSEGLAAIQTAMKWNVMWQIVTSWQEDTNICIITGTSDQKLASVTHPHIIPNL